MKNHNSLHLDCPEQDFDYWTTLPHYLRDHMTRSHGPVLVCEYAVNGCEYTTHQRSSHSRCEEYCSFKPFSTDAEEGDGENGNEGDADAE